MPVYNGTNGNDNIIGSIFTDSIFGLGGDDTLNPGSGVNDYIDGGAGIDLLVADYSNVSGPYSFSFDNIEKVSFKGSNGDDNFTFNNTTDTLYGNGGNDTLNAGAFDDYLDGGSGSDSLFGGDGNDTLNPGSGVNDYIDGGAGIDLLVADYSNVSGPYNFSFNNIEKVFFKGSNGDDNFTFNNTTDSLYGNGGNDTLNSGAFNDYLDGGSGNDSLFGGDGNDTIYGGADKDTLYGGLGADKFRFYFQSEGIDIIKDFQRSEGDKIEIVKSSFGANSLNQFSYNSSNGALFFDASSSDNVGAVRLATIENKPSGFSVQQDIIFA